MPDREIIKIPANRTLADLRLSLIHIYRQLILHFLNGQLFFHPKHRVDRPSHARVSEIAGAPG